MPDEPNQSQGKSVASVAVEIVDDKGNVQKEFEIVSERENTAHPGTFIIEVKEKK